MNGVVDVLHHGAGLRWLVLGAVALALSAGCGRELKVNLAQVDTTDVIRWRQEITDAVNEHEDRLKRLEEEVRDGK